MQRKKDMFFFSNYCDHSKSVINAITKKNMRDLFMFVPVDNPKFNIPQFIKMVPTVLSTNNEIITGQSLYNYIEKLAQSFMPQNGPEDVSPFTIGSSSYSSQYTWLTADGYDNEGSMLNNDQTQHNSFVLLNSDHRINAPKDSDSENKSSKFDSSIYEKYINSRTNDDENIKRILDSETRNSILR